MTPFYKVPSVEEIKLPKNLTEYALNSGYYTPEERQIIESEAEDILKNIAGRTWTSLQVAEAFCKASAYAQELTNCVTEVLYAEAFERARFLDDYLAKNGKTFGPLHGLPISLKDCFITAPHPSSIGMDAFGNEPLKTDTLIVSMLRDLGAVFYIKTNVPVAMMMAESINHVWGESRNPLHKYLTCGGSSGGEGAIIAFKASPLGIGTDIGGSIRIPSRILCLVWAQAKLWSVSHLWGKVWHTRSGIDPCGERSDVEKFEIIENILRSIVV
ncbi:hypothetical protein ABVK25_012455 [Lepraria finkii]|uniref:amidase n=1 Tax=Lepraria finkii TaxID=1340010 RepID=A0ABR4AF68_9LECA